MTDNLIGSLRQLRDRLQVIPARLGVHTMIVDGVEVVTELGETLLIPLAQVLEPTQPKEFELSIENVSVSKQFCVLVISTDYKALVNTSCRFYFRDVEWLPVRWEETTLDLRVTLRYQYDGEWGTL